MSSCLPFSQDSATASTTTEASILPDPSRSNDNVVDQENQENNEVSVEYTMHNISFDLCEDSSQNPKGKKRRVTDKYCQSGRKIKEEEAEEVYRKMTKPPELRCPEEQVVELKMEKEALEISVRDLRRQLEEKANLQAESQSQNQQVLSQNQQLETEVRRLRLCLQYHKEESSKLRTMVRSREMTINFLRNYLDQSLERSSGKGSPKKPGPDDRANNNRHEIFVASVESICQRMIAELNSDADSICRSERSTKGERSQSDAPTGLAQLTEQCSALVFVRMGELRNARESIKDLRTDLAKAKESRQLLEIESGRMRASLQSEVEYLTRLLEQNEEEVEKSHFDKGTLERQLSEERRATASVQSELEVTKQSLSDLQKANEGLEARASALQSSLKEAVTKAQLLPKREKELQEAKLQMTHLGADLAEEKKLRRKLEDDLSMEVRLREKAEAEVNELSRRLEEADDGSLDEEGSNAPQALTQMVTHFSSKVGSDHGEDATRVNDHMSKLRKLLERQVNDHLKRHFSRYRDSEYLLHDRSFSLCEKIKQLESEGRFPKLLIRAMHEMRMLGNDATHGRRALERQSVEPVVANFNRLNDMFERGELPLESRSSSDSRLMPTSANSRCVRWG